MINLTITKILNQFGLHKIDYFTELISYIPFLIATLAIISILILRYNKTNGKKIIISIMFSLILVFTINELIIKNVTHIDRPYIQDKSIIPIGYQFKDSSFASTHVASVIAVTSIILFYYYKNRKIVLSLGLFSLILSFSRLHNGMHFPIDVIIGSFIGFICAIISLSLIKNYKKNRR